MLTLSTHTIISYHPPPPLNLSPVVPPPAAASPSTRASLSILELTARNIFLVNEFRESFNSIFKQHFIPKSPSFYVNVPSHIDPTAALHGKDAVVVLVPVGHLISSDSSKHKGTTSSGSNSDVKTPQN